MAARQSDGRARSVQTDQAARRLIRLCAQPIVLCMNGGCKDVGRTGSFMTAELVMLLLKWERMGSDGSGRERLDDRDARTIASRRRGGNEQARRRRRSFSPHPPPPPFTHSSCRRAAHAPSDNLDRNNRRRSTLHTCPRHPARRSSNTGGGLSYSLIRYYKQRGPWTWA